MMAAADPRGIAERLFAHLLLVLGGGSGAVLAVKNSRPIAFVDRTTLDGLARARAIWDTGAEQLRSGTSISSGSSWLVPLIIESALVGGVWLEGVPCAQVDLGEVALPLALAVTAPTVLRPGLEDILGQTEEELQRERTIGLLHRHEWNIAVVARSLGVTRRTIYMRLERWGIERLRIPRGRRSRRRLATSET